MSKKANPPPPPPVRGAQALLALGLAESALSLFQWSQLITLRNGGTTVCSVSEHVNCEAVWNSAFASAVHGLARMPVAGLGLVWGLVAVALSALYLVWAPRGRDVRPAVNGLRLTAAAGVLSCVVFAGVSASTGVLCPTCLGTYALTLGFAAVAFKGLPGPVLPRAGEWAETLKWSAGFAAAAYVALLVPGMNTPRANAATQAVAEAPVGSLPDFLAGLSGEEKQAVSDALAAYRRETPQAADFPARRLYGPASAPVKMVEWTDSRCPHCKALVETLAVMKKRLPEGKLSLEARQFPLDSACNFSLPPNLSDGSGTRCLAAKGMICLEGAPDYWEVRERLFEAQRTLTSRDAILDVLGSGGTTRAQLEACVSTQDTQKKLQEDVVYAQHHNLRGTPLVVVNGRNAAAFPPFLYALVLADGNPDAPAFQTLPAPRALQAQQVH